MTYNEGRTKRLAIVILGLAFFSLAYFAHALDLNYLGADAVREQVAAHPSWKTPGVYEATLGGDSVDFILTDSPPAQPKSSAQTGTNRGLGFPYWPSELLPLLPCTGTNCVNFCQLLTFFQRLIYFGMTLAVEIIAPVFLIWGMFMILISAGSSERLGQGKTILTTTIVGVVLALGAFLIVSTLLWLLGNPASGGVSWPNVACVI